MYGLKVRSVDSGDVNIVRQDIKVRIKVSSLDSTETSGSAPYHARLSGDVSIALHDIKVWLQGR